MVNFVLPPAPPPPVTNLPVELCASRQLKIAKMFLGNTKCKMHTKKKKNGTKLGVWTSLEAFVYFIISATKIGL